MAKFITLLILFILPSAVWAASAEDCYEAYANFATGSRAAGASSLGLSSVILSTTSGVGSTAASSGLIGSTMVGNSFFDRAVAESILEAQANVVGPFTLQLTQSLNNGLYQFDIEKPQSVGGTWAMGTREAMVRRLNGGKVTPEEVLAATREMIATGRMCLIEGNSVHTLDDLEWSKRVVDYVSQHAR